jgi:hypothetical protein
MKTRASPSTVWWMCIAPDAELPFDGVNGSGLRSRVSSYDGLRLGNFVRPLSSEMVTFAEVS